MSTPNADAARETSRQDNGQFGTQPLAEVDIDLAAERAATIAVHQVNEARLDAQYAAHDEDSAADHMAFTERTMANPPEPETGYCSQCGNLWMEDPAGSPGVKVHMDDETGRPDHDQDEDHTPVPEADEMANRPYSSEAFPNGKCGACGFGLDEHGSCYQHDCSAFDADSPLADVGSTTSGEEVEVVKVSELAVGDVLLEGTVTSIDNDHKTTSIELDGDESTIAEYANDERIARYLPEDRECDDDCVEHAAWCDGYCNHTDSHRNKCLDVPAAEQPLTSANRADRPHPDLADEDVDKAFGE